MKVEAENVFIADCGAFCHLVGSNQGIYEWEHINDNIIIGNGKGICANEVGKLKMLLHNNKMEMKKYYI